VQKISKAKKSSIGRNPFFNGQSGTVPFAVTHDGRTIRFADPNIKVNDTVRLDIATGKPTGHLKFEIGQLAMVTRGANVGRVGVIGAIDRHPGSFDIVHLKDRRNNVFATRIGNVFVIGEGNKPWISLPRQKGIKQTIMEEREETLTKANK